jgi:hypothetical protein
MAQRSMNGGLMDGTVRVSHVETQSETKAVYRINSGTSQRHASAIILVPRTIAIPFELACKHRFTSSTLVI